MNTSVRARRGARGFSFVELLVTIIIAGIAFAALVPVFVQGMQVGSGDKMRLLALNLAQDRVEKIRQLDFELITEDNLRSGAFYFGEFGSTWMEQTESGSKQFSVKYVVEDKQVSATDTRIAYKLVTVIADWDGPPYPHKLVHLKTAVYRQYAGPEIVLFNVRASDLEGQNPASEVIVSPIVHLSATVNAADLDSMKRRDIGVPPNQRTLLGHVDVLITSGTGAVYPTEKLPYNALSPTPALFTYDWPVPGGLGANDGYYTFKAIAFTSSGSPGNSWEFSMRVETGPPASVTSLTVTPGKTTADLTWLPSLSGDLAHYEVYRTHLDSLTKSPDGPVVPLAVDLSVTTLSYSDSGLTQDDWYLYQVYAVDWADLSSTPAEVQAQPIDTVALRPLPASNLKGEVINSSARLTWTAPTSGPAVAGYHVFVNGSTTSAYTATSATFDVPQGWGTEAWYQVKPYAAGGWESAAWATPLFPGSVPENVGGTPWAKVIVPAELRYTLNIMNTTNKTLLSLKLYFLGPAGNDLAVLVEPTATNKAVGTLSTWSNLAAGKYRWAWVKSNNQSGLKEGWLTGLGQTINEGTPNP